MHRGFTKNRILCGCGVTIVYAGLLALLIVLYTQEQLYHNYNAHAALVTRVEYLGADLIGYKTYWKIHCILDNGQVCSYKFVEIPNTTFVPNEGNYTGIWANHQRPPHCSLRDNSRSNMLFPLVMVAILGGGGVLFMWMVVIPGVGGL
jgi:hypothetical protein